MTLYKFSNILLFATILVLFIACDKDDPVIPNEEEVITTLQYSLTPMNGGAAVLFEFRDLDGDGGNAPAIIASGALSANTNYAGDLRLLNELESPAENITTEVEEEASEHQFFYAVSSDLDAVVSYDDTDENGNPIGLRSSFTTGAASSGQLTLTLRHEPNKTAAGVADGAIENAGGETDIEVTFDINIQ